jgi:hypothetical protein
MMCSTTSSTFATKCDRHWGGSLLPVVGATGFGRGRVMRLRLRARVEDRCDNGPMTSDDAARTPAARSMAADAELRRLIREGLESGITGEQGEV